MNLKEIKEKIVSNFNEEEGAELNIFNADIFNEYDVSNYVYCIEGFSLFLDWSKAIEKHYNIPLLNTNDDIVIQGDSELSRTTIIENTNDKLVIFCYCFADEGQMPVNYTVTFFADGHSEYDLGEFKHDYRDYTNYIDDIEAIGKYLNYDTKKFTSEQLSNIIKNYIDIFLAVVPVCRALFTPIDTELIDKASNELDNKIVEFSRELAEGKMMKFNQLPLELKKNLFNHIANRVMRYDFEYDVEYD